MPRADLTPVNPMRQRSLGRASGASGWHRYAHHRRFGIKFSRRNTVVMVEHAAQSLASQN